MRCTEIHTALADLHADRLDASEREAVQTHLASCAGCQAEWQSFSDVLTQLDSLPPVEVPSARLRASFHQMLERATAEEAATAAASAPTLRQRWDSFFASLLPGRPSLQFAFTLALAAGGFWLGTRNVATPVVNTQSGDTTPAAQTTAPATDPALLAELTALRAKVDRMEGRMAVALRDQPASNRLQAAIASLDPNKADDRTLTELLNTLAYDPSTNVRLAALETLYTHADRDIVRAGIVAALPRENSPLVQVAMIDFVVASRDSAAAPVLEQMVRDLPIESVVRNAAQRGLAQL